jgi:hypothetical protein
MIPKSGYRFSDKIMLQTKNLSPPRATTAYPVAPGNALSVC